jgi:phosphoribosylglycinamide formyltransferase-1
VGAILWGFESPLRHFNMQKGRVAIFLSGRGSNFEAIYRSSRLPASNFEIVMVISDKKDARGLETAKEFGLSAIHISPKRFKSKKEYEMVLVKHLREKKVDLVCLAGYMRIVGVELRKAFKNRIINIHPALLPSFPGLHAQKQAFEYGVKITGCTVHFIDSGVDTGPIILQESVNVFEEDDEESLSKRILAVEHKMYSQAIRMFFENRLKLQGRKVIIS